MACLLLHSRPEISCAAEASCVPGGGVVVSTNTFRLFLVTSFSLGQGIQVLIGPRWSEVTLHLSAPVFRVNSADPDLTLS